MLEGVDFQQYCIVFLHVVQATTVCEGEKNITFLNVFPIQSITSVMANFFYFKREKITAIHYEERLLKVSVCDVHHFH